ncbi:hypothetical protein [Candidatus Odyssella thessalonicensis]|uniref:hypothetical protein n=1 Tax=Candidatus Odyssella thessalonicensis TaxID=84647 RepID=UPI0002E2ED08|nr:hypothetical protein [Candidatus Odyssella thessalonicensis]
MIKNKLMISCFHPVPKLDQDTLIIACPIMIHNYGLPYYLEGFAYMRATYPALALEFAVPAHQDVGLALRALAAGLKQVYFDLKAPAWDQLKQMAATYGAELRDQGELHGYLD